MMMGTCIGKILTVGMVPVNLVFIIHPPHYYQLNFLKFQNDSLCRWVLVCWMRRRLRLDTAIQIHAKVDALELDRIILFQIKLRFLDPSFQQLAPIV
jgi:hypothetical protein